MAPFRFEPTPKLGSTDLCSELSTYRWFRTGHARFQQDVLLIFVQNANITFEEQVVRKIASDDSVSIRCGTDANIIVSMLAAFLAMFYMEVSKFIRVNSGIWVTHTSDCAPLFLDLER